MKQLRNIMMNLVSRYEDFIIKRGVKATVNRMKKLDVKNYVDSAEAIANNIYMEFSGARRERLFAYYIDIEGGIIKRKTISVGTIDTASVYIRELAREAIMSDAAGVILAHTHIAHSSDPSDGDLQVTRKVQQALNVLDISLYDHIIVSKSGFFSFREEDILPDPDAKE
jgi:DNA repair protein RadC